MTVYDKQAIRRDLSHSQGWRYGRPILHGSGPFNWNSMSTLVLTQPAQKRIRHHIGHGSLEGLKSRHLRGISYPTAVRRVAAVEYLSKRWCLAILASAGVGQCWARDSWFEALLFGWPGWVEIEMAVQLCIVSILLLQPACRKRAETGGNSIRCQLQIN